MQELEKTDIKPNDKQQLCIDSIDGKYLVLAGPGTGKTFTVIKRLQNMINKGIAPERILCLTYSRAAAGEMKKRVLKDLSEADCGIEIHTFHSFCNKIIGDYVEDFSLPLDFKVIPDAIKRLFLKECLDEMEDVTYYRSDKANPYTKLGSLLEKIQELKTHRIFDKKDLDRYVQNNPEWYPEIKRLEIERDTNPRPRKNYEKAIADLQKKIAELNELWRFFEAYRAKMQANGFIDFDDMINFILEKFENSPAFAEKIAAQYDYIFVDEFQDTNASENELIFNLVKNAKAQNVFVVGDDEQIIYASQGARLDNIEQFLVEFPDTEVICLTENMRSNQNILDFARSVADCNLNRIEANPTFAKYNIEKKLTAKNKNLPDNKVRFNAYGSADFQYADIVREIDELIKSDDCPKDDKGEKNLSQIAILATGHEELGQFARYLHDRNIPYEQKDGKNIFEIKATVYLYYYLQALVNPALNADKLYRILLSPPFNIEASAFMRLYERESMDLTFLDTMRNLDNKTEKVKEFLKTFDELQELKNSETVYHVVAQCAAKTGIIDYFCNSDIAQAENVFAIKRFLDEAIDFTKQNKKVTLEEFVQMLDIAYADGIKITVEKPASAMNAVQLSTYLSSKGKEYEYVYMPSLQPSKWESNGKPALKPTIPTSVELEKTDDEWKSLRLNDKINKMFVGMTRAKHTLRLSYISGDGATHSRFIEITDDLKDKTEINNYPVNTYKEQLDSLNLSLVVKEYDYLREFKERLNAVLQDVYYSPSFVNDYIKCPQMFFFNRILDINPPAGSPDFKNFGIAVHKACEEAINYTIKNKRFYDSAEPFVASFNATLNKLPLSSLQVRNHLLETGKKVLTEYYEKDFSLMGAENLHAAEKTIIVDFEGIKFKGKIDRVDIVDDKYIIYDYKTGSPKSEKDICIGGNHEDYYIQMGLYKYFLEKIDTSGREVLSTKFIFPENYKKTCAIEFDEQNLDEVMEKYRNAIKGIQNHDFKPTPSENACKYCAYKNDVCNCKY